MVDEIWGTDHPHFQGCAHFYAYFMHICAYFGHILYLFFESPPPPHLVGGGTSEQGGPLGMAFFPSLDCTLRATPQLGISSMKLAQIRNGHQNFFGGCRGAPFFLPKVWGRDFFLVKECPALERVIVDEAMNLALTHATIF